MKIFDSKIKRYPSAYILQCGLATLVLMVLFLIENVLAHPVVLAAIGSTTFIVFAMPSNISATPRRIIGGHLVGVVVGGLFALLEANCPDVYLQGHAVYVDDLLAAMSVGLAIFLMTLTNTEHAPAAGTALGLVVIGWDIRIAMFVLIAAMFLSLVHVILRSWLKDLT